MATLLNVDTALETILAQMQTVPAETRALAQAHGYVLAADIVSAIDLPPFANASMDGYAVHAADSAPASPTHPVGLQVTLDIPAGAAPQQRLNRGEAARIMTGAPLPAGADAIVPVEDTDGQWTEGAPLPPVVHLHKAVQTGDYVRPSGENVRAGATVLQAGTWLRAAEMGIIAGLGQAQVAVLRQPRVAIVGSGDELVEPGHPLQPGQIYDSNSFTLAALVEETGAIALRLPIARDTLADIRAVFQQALALQPDMIVSSAGVSVGAADFTRQVLAELGAVSFWRINLRPGKPLAFGQLRGVPFFGLPGNPVSAMVTFDVLVRPALLKIAGKRDNATYITAYTAEKIRSDGRRSYLRVTLSRRADGQWLAHTTGTQSSGALISMVMADGLLIVPEDVLEVEASTPMRVKLLRNLP